jgi:ubiquinone/menaquinone biosynthesis C-methylase UbiE
VSWLLPTLYDFSMRHVERACLAEWRTTLLADARGDVLEIGAGTGANLGRYGPDVARIVMTEPEARMRDRLAPRLSREPRPVEVVDASAESLPFADGSFDTAVSTLVLCSVADADRALAELARVLRPGGVLLFIEHVAADDGTRRRRWQERVQPLWKRLSGNCHLARHTDRAIERAGFSIERMDRESIQKAIPLVRPSIRGAARRT